MTLGRFMKDYLYIPLGGNKVTIKRMYFNLIFVFVVSGFWHGAAWNFIIWGAFHGLFLIMDRLFLLKLFDKIGKYPSIIITFFITIIGWVIFRATSVEQIGYYLKAMFKFNFADNYILSNQFVVISIFAILFSFITMFAFGKKLEDFVFFKKQYSNTQLLIFFVGVILLFVLSAVNIAASSFNPFIYFRF
jgi:alginate O-acetyltransferase complex protein AlgI